LDAPTFLEPSDSSLLNATVYNRGLSNETNVELFLLINGTEVGSAVIPALLNGSSYTLSYLWTPTVEGIYNVTAYAPPVPDENITINNVNSRYVIVARAQTMWVESNVTGPVPTCDSFSVDIYINLTAARMNPGANGLWAWEFRLYYENDKLNCTGFTDHLPSADWNPPNSFAGGAGIEQNYNATHGRVWRAIAALPFQPPWPTAFVGVMSVCTIEFHVIYEGEQYIAPLIFAKNYGIDANLGDDTGEVFDFTAYDGYVTVIGMAPQIPGDVNRDGTVNILDVLIAVVAFGSQPGDPNWNPDADLDGNWIINILDMVIIGVNFGKTG